MWTFSGPTMGTAYTVKVVAPGLDDQGKSAVHEAIRSAVDGIDDAMSTYKPNSELSRFNSGDGGLFSMSPEMAHVVGTALEISAASDGALDPTVGLLVDAWGFGPDGWTAPPSEASLEALRESVGLHHLEINLEAGTLRKIVPDVRIDLSAVAKGFAVDQVFEALAALGHADVMVEIGGEVRTSGHRADGAPWRIGIERPDADGRVVADAVELTQSALATSGDYRNYYIYQGHRISHTIDPRTGRPVEHNLASISVVAPTCIEADAWATALNVLGPVEGMALAQEFDLAALFITRTKAGFEERATRGFPRRH